MGQLMSERAHPRPRQESSCRISSSSGGTLEAAIKSIDQAGILLDTPLAITSGMALDVTLSLAEEPPMRVRASVVGSNAEGLRLKWLPINSADSQRISSALTAFRRRHQSQPMPVVRSTTLEGIFPGAGHGEAASLRWRGPGTSGAPGSVARVRDEAAHPSQPMSDPSQAMSDSPDVPAAREPTVGRRVVRFDRNGHHHPHQNGAGPTPLAIPGEAKPEPSINAPCEANGSGIRDQVPCADAAHAGDRPTAKTGAIDGLAGVPDAALADLDEAPAESSATGQQDILAKIHQRVKSVRSADLAARHEHVRVLNIMQIKGLIRESVDEASHELDKAWSEAQRKSIFEEAEKTFQGRLQELDAEKLSTDKRLSALAEQLEAAQKVLEEERSRKIQGDQFTVSPSSLELIEGKFRRMLEHYASEGKVAPELEQELRNVIATVFDQERQRIRELELLAQNDRIKLLEGKIKRLSHSLEEAERQRDEFQEWASHAEGGLRNIFTAGIKAEDPNKQRKLALMKEILAINRDIRKSLVQFEAGRGRPAPEKHVDRQSGDCVAAAS